MEEDEPEVSLTFFKPAYLRDVHASASERQIPVVGGFPEGRSPGYGLMGRWDIRIRRWGWISQTYVRTRSLSLT